MTESIVLGGGCFWCTEAIFKRLRGVVEVTPGYAGGTTKDPSYMDVSSGRTGHIEVIELIYDPEIIPIQDILEIFLETHDPTSRDKQGNDTGTQYRSTIFYTTEEQKEKAKSLINTLSLANRYQKPIVTEIKPLEKFFKAENYHLNYYENNRNQPYCQIVISPKLRHLEEKFGEKTKQVS